MDQSDLQEEIIVGNRRLRKIKRPKYPNAPVTNVPESYEQTFTPAQETPAYITEDFSSEDTQTYIEDPSMQEYAYPSNLQTFDSKKVTFIGALCLIVGLVFGKMMFSSSSAQGALQGLQGVVVNPEVPQGRSRCGVAERTQGCVLYIMNPQRQELNGRDFYDWAAQLTGRQRFVIETGNMRYSSIKIRPGAIAQINIPPLDR